MLDARYSMLVVPVLLWWRGARKKRANAGRAGVRV